MMMNKKLSVRKLIFTALCMVLLSCVFLGYSLIGNKADALSAVPTSTTVVNPLYDFNDYRYDEAALNDLAKQVLNTNSSDTTINTLINYAKTTAGTKGKAVRDITPSSRGNDITLKYGRYRFTSESLYRDLTWIPVYVSQSSSGDAILTLYLAATSNDLSTSRQETAPFTSYSTYTSDQSCTMPSNSYGNSAIRAATLGNGGTYAYYPSSTDTRATSYTANIKEADCNKFSDFIKGTGEKKSDGSVSGAFTGLLYDDIATPAEMSWQATESFVDSIGQWNGNDYCWPNEAYGRPASGDYYYPGYFDYTTKNKTNYNEWKNDKVWLPSYTEVGDGDYDGNQTDTRNGIWKLTATDRSNPTAAWLRTANTTVNKTSGYSTYTMFCTEANGSIGSKDVGSYNGTKFATTNAAVRPAIHLNLSKIVTKTVAPIRLPDTVYSTYNGEVQTIMSAPDDQRQWYDDKIMNITFYSDEERLRPIGPQDAGTYYMEVSLKGTDRYFFGEDKSVTRKTTKFVVQKVKLDVVFVYDTVNETLPLRAEIVDKENAIYQRDIDAGFVPEVGMKYSNVAGIGLQNVTYFPDKKGTYKATAYIIDEDIYNYNYELSNKSMDSKQFLVTERDILEPRFVVGSLGDNEHLTNDGTKLELAYRGKRYIQIENISPYVEIKVSARTEELAKSVIDCGLREDGVQVYLVENVGDYTFTVTLVDTNNTQWSNSTPNNKDVTDKVLSLHIEQAEITVTFDGLPGSWEYGTKMEFGLNIFGVYEEAGGNVPMQIYYQRVNTQQEYIQPNEHGRFVLPDTLETGTYTIGAVLNTSLSSGNYVMANNGAAVTQKIEIVETVGQFNVNEAVWMYDADGNPSNVSYPAVDKPGSSASNPITVPYGPVYDFHLTINEDRLKDEKHVRAIYSGDLNVSDAGLHKVTVRITAYDKNVKFTDKEFEVYFLIEQKKYDLSSVKWTYDSSNPFVYTGNEQKVMIDPVTLPAGLTATYHTLGIPGNAMTNAGEYTTEVVFKLSEEYAKNYMLPTADDADSYTGTFNFECVWKIDPQTIEVKWTSGDSSSNIIFIPTLQTGHSYVDYSYQHKDGENWVDCDSVTAATTVDEQYRVKPTVKSVYAGNFVLSSDDWHEFTLQSGKQPVTVHIEINNKKCDDGDTFTYTGNPFTATAVVDAGGIGISGSSAEYYNVTSSGAKGSKLSSAPVNAGKYIAVVTAAFEGGYTAPDSKLEVMFEITKADFDMSGVSWQIEYGKTVIKAFWDSDQQKWVNANGEEASFAVEYDGNSYQPKLVGIDAVDGLTIDRIDNDAYTNAGTYTALVRFAFENTNYNDPTDSGLFPSTIEWTVKKAKIHFENVEWGYTVTGDDKEHRFDFENDTFVFTRDENGLIYYTVGLINLPEGAKTQLTYTTTCKTQVGATAQPGATHAAVGVYETIVSGSINLPDSGNYEGYHGSLPVFIPTFLNWEITARELTVPSFDNSWTKFDDKVHDIIDMCGVPEEDLPYYRIKIMFVDPTFGIDEDYKGYAEGQPYSAYHAGTYTVSFYELMGEEEEEYLWKQIEITVEKEKLVVSWDLNGSIPTARVRGVDITDILGTKYSKEQGGEFTYEYVQSTDGVKFYAEPYIRGEYAKDYQYVMGDGESEKIPFTTEKFRVNDSSRPLAKPAMVSASQEYTGKPIKFEIANWSTYSQYLYVSGDDLTQTEVGVYHVIVNFIKYNGTTGAGNAYWADSVSKEDPSRNPYTLTFEVTKPASVSIDIPKFDRLEADATGSVLEFVIENWSVIKDYLDYEIGDLIEVRSGVLGQSLSGVYEVTFRFKEDSTAVWKDTGKQDPRKVTIIINETGEVKIIPKPTLEKTVEEWTGNPIAFRLNNQSYYEQYLEGMTQLIVTNPGEYKATLTIKSTLDITFSDGTKTVELTFKVDMPTTPDAPVKLGKPVLESNSAQYTGSEIEFKIKDWDKLKVYLEIIEGSLTRTEVDDYQIKIGFKSGSKATWEDGTTSTYTLSFRITEVPKADPERLSSPQLTVDHKSFTGNPIAFDIADWDKLSKYVRIVDNSGNELGAGFLVEQSQAGKYDFWLQIKDPSAAVWENGTTDDLKLSFEITKANIPAGEIKPDDQGNLIIPDGNGGYANLDDYFEKVYYDKDGNKVTEDDFVDGEEYTVKVELIPDKEEEFRNNVENADELLKQFEEASWTFVYKAPGGMNMLMIITIIECVILVILVIATIVVLAVKRREYVDDYDDGDDYEEDDD